MMLVVAAAALMAGQQPAAPPRCSLAALDRCRNMNSLIWAPGTKEAIGAFLGNRRGGFVGRGGLVADQAVEVLGGPPDEAARIGPYWRFTTCRAHSCTEKGALVANPAGTIVAVAILHSRCSLAHPGNDCSSHDTLTIYIRHAGPDVVRNIREWGPGQIAGTSIAGLRPPTLDAVEVVPA